MVFRPGLFRRICDRTGFAVMSSDTVKQWNGVVVRKSSAEPRHPQEFVRGKSDKQTVPMPRPRQTEQFVGPLTTTVAAAASAGDQTIEVDSSVRFAGGDQLGIALDNGDIHRAVLMTVPDASHIQLTAPLPFSAAEGNIITNYSAVSVASVD